MMGRKSGQMSMVILELSELIPETHLLRTIRIILQMAAHQLILSACLKCCW